MEIADAPPDPDLPLPLSQHPMFAAALKACGRRAELVVLRQGHRRIGQVLLVSRRLGPLGSIALASRGPVWDQDARLNDQIEGIRALRGCGLAMVEAENQDSRHLRYCGYRQMTTPAHVAELDLRGGPAAIRARAQGKWRNRMAQAERAGLTIRSLPFDGETGDWLFRMEAAQQRRKGYVSLPVALSAAFAQIHPGMARLFIAEREVVPIAMPVAAMLFLRHGSVATYQIGWSGSEGRDVSAHHLILMHAANWLAARGHTRLDLGTVDTETAPGLARFKLGSGAQMRSLGGSWLRLPFLSQSKAGNREQIRLDHV